MGSLKERLRLNSALSNSRQQKAATGLFENPEAYKTFCSSGQNFVLFRSLFQILNFEFKRILKLDPNGNRKRMKN